MFIIASCNGTKLFKFGKKILDEMTRLVEILLIRALLLAIFLGWNDHFNWAQESRAVPDRVSVGSRSVDGVANAEPSNRELRNTQTI